MSQFPSSRARAHLRAVAEAHVAPHKVPGLVLLVGRGEEAHVEALGTLSVGGPPVRRDSLFRISSNTKPITAAATLSLVREGLLTLDAPVARWLPELAHPRVLRRPDGPLEDTVPAARAITVRDLLTFTFGFGMCLEMFSPPKWPVVEAEEALRLSTLGPPAPDVAPAPDEWMKRLGSLPLMAQPGERWLYNTGAAVLGVLQARAAGTSFGEVLRTRLFEPLGMRDTAFFARDTSRLAMGYAPTPKGLQVSDRPSGLWSRPPAFEDGAAGLVSTADDLFAFARMFLRGGAPVLDAALVREMTRDQLTPAQKAQGGLGPGFFDQIGWGFGVAVTTGGEHPGAFGWAGGLGTTWLVDPARELTVIVLTQRMFDGPATPPHHVALQRAAYEALAL